MIILPIIRNSMKIDEFFYSGELKSCPFCDENKYLIIKQEGINSNKVCCENCSATGPFSFRTHMGALKLWNRRPKGSYIKGEYNG